MATNTISYPFVEAKQGKHRLIIFFAKAKDLWKCVSVNQKEEDADGGYQRAFSASRTGAIKRFVEAGNPIPLSILVTLDKKHMSENGSVITIKQAKNSGWVIDGQHRLIGSMEAKTDIYLPVVAMIGLSLEEQISQFVTINREARGVPTSLYYSLLKKLPPKLTPAETAKERAADIALILRSDEESPFSGRIVATTSPKTGQISLVNFVRKVAPLVRDDSGILGTFSIDEQARIISNYYLAIKNVFTKQFEATDSVFFQTVGFGALLNFFPVAFNYTIANKQSFAIADVTATLKILNHIDVLSWKKAGTGNAIENSLGADLKEEFRKLTEGTNGKSTSINLG